MAIHDEHRESILKQLDNANAQKLLYEHRITRLENRSQYLPRDRPDHPGDVREVCPEGRAGVQARGRTACLLSDPP